MTFRSSQYVLCGIGVMMACLLGVTTVNGQPAPGQKPQRAEDVFKNVQVLKGIPVGEFLDTMGFFSAALGLNCIHCHVDASLTHWERFADDVPRKRMARMMIMMVNNVNKTNFGGRRLVTCNSCHRGNLRPEAIPSLTVQYGLPLEDPDTVEAVPDAPAGPSADDILDKYIRALGGAQRLAGLASFIGKGTYE